MRYQNAGNHRAPHRGYINTGHKITKQITFDQRKSSCYTRHGAEDIMSSVPIDQTPSHSSMTNAALRELAARIRLNATRMVAIEGFGYLGQALSSAEIFSVLFAGGIIRQGHD